MSLVLVPTVWACFNSAKEKRIGYGRWGRQRKKFKKIEAIFENIHPTHKDMWARISQADVVNEHLVGRQVFEPVKRCKKNWYIHDKWQGSEVKWYKVLLWDEGEKGNNLKSEDQMNKGQQSSSTEPMRADYREPSHTQTHRHALTFTLCVINTDIL